MPLRPSSPLLVNLEADFTLPIEEERAHLHPFERCRYS